MAAVGKHNLDPVGAGGRAEGAMGGSGNFSGDVVVQTG